MKEEKQYIAPIGDELKKIKIYPSFEAFKKELEVTSWDSMIDNAVKKVNTELL